MIFSPMRKPALAALVAVLLFVCGPASADTVAARFPRLVAEIQTRLTQLALPPLSRLQKRQKAACTKVQKPLAAATDDLAKFLVSERTVVATLDPSFKDDATVAQMLDDILLAAQTDVLEVNAFVNVRANALPTSALRKKSLAVLAGAGRFMTLAGDAKRARATRIAYLSKVLAYDASADKLVRKALLTSGVVVTQMELHADAHALVATTGTSSLTFAMYVAADDKLTVIGGFESMGVRRDLQFRVDGPAVGDRPVVLSQDTFFHDDRGIFSATSGTVHVTTWDPANHKAAGTFEMVFSNGAATVNVTQGAFSYIDLQTQ